MKELVSELANLSSPNHYKVLDPDEKPIIQLPQHSPPPWWQWERENGMTDTQSTPSRSESNFFMSGWCDQDFQRDYLLKFIGHCGLCTSKTVVAILQQLNCIERLSHNFQTWGRMLKRIWLYDWYTNHLACWLTRLLSLGDFNVHANEAAVSMQVSDQISSMATLWLSQFVIRPHTLDGPHPEFNLWYRDINGSDFKGGSAMVRSPGLEGPDVLT